MQIHTIRVITKPEPSPIARFSGAESAALFTVSSKVVVLLALMLPLPTVAVTVIFAGLVVAVMGVPLIVAVLASHVKCSCVIKKHTRD